MQKVLSLLVAFVFLQANTWALSGGPVYPGDTAAVKGTYAGTLIGLNSVGNPADPNNLTGANGLGIFAIAVPTSGPGKGAFAFFNQGDTFFGTIVGIIDPDLLTLNALVRGTATTNSVNAAGNVVAAPYGWASGQVIANLVQPEHSSFSSSQGFRVEGKAFIDLSFLTPGNIIVSFGTLDVSVVGFQQSTDTDAIPSFGAAP